MRKAFVYILSATMLVAACVDNLQNELVPSDESGTLITETITARVSEGDTKATIATTGGAFAWTMTTDKIAVHTTGDGGLNPAGYVISGGASESAAEAGFTVQYYGERDAFAIYPSRIVAADAENYGQEGHTLDVTLPSTYTLAEVSGETSPCPMIAANRPGSGWEFKQLCFLLRLTVEHIPTGTSSLLLDFKGNQVCGDFAIASTVTPGSSTISTSSMTGSSPANAGDKIAITNLGGASSVTINIPLPVGQYEKIGISYLSNTSENLGDVVAYLNNTTAPTSSTPSPTFTALRAGGRKLTVDNAKLAFRGYWIAPGTLKREVDGSNVTYSITDGNPTEFIGYFGQSSSLSKYYFQKSTLSAELDKLPTGWKLPSQSEWKTFMWSNPQTAIYFNGTSITGDPTNAQKGCFILIHLVDTDVDIYGLLLLRDGAHIDCPEIPTSNVGKKSSSYISTVNLSVINNLISNYGCVFLPGTGNYLKNRTIGAGYQEWAYLETDSFLPNEELTHYFWLDISSSAVSITNNSSTGPELHSSMYYPVRLIKAAI